MPALARIRQVAYRMQSAENLAAIGKACLLYSLDHSEKYPPDLETLVKEIELPQKTLVSKRKPKAFTGPSYIYITGQSSSMPPGNIIVYENPEFCIEGTNVLFNDGHVRFMKQAEFIKELQATYNRLGRKMSPIRFGSWYNLETKTAI